MSISSHGTASTVVKQRRLRSGQGLLQRLAVSSESPAVPALEIPAPWYRTVLAGVFLLSFASQIGLYLYGLYSISADESERTLLARDLTFAKAFEPFVWPPLPKILTGLALKLHNDLILTPRVVVAFAGLLTLGALILLTQRLFENRMIALVAGMLGVFIPQRLILSVVPLSDVFAYLFVLSAAGFLIDWLRRGRARALTCVSLCLLLAATVRYEAWFFNVVLAFFLAYLAIIRRSLGVGVFLLNVALLAAFPSGWVINTYLHDGSLANFSLTSQQFLELKGHDVLFALRHNAVVELLQDVVFEPALLIGSLALLYVILRDRAIRVWVMLLFLPLLILAAMMTVTLAVPLAATFRVDGVWVLLLAPFAAYGIVWLAEWSASTRARQYLAVIFMSYVFVVPFALRAQMITEVSLRQPDGVISIADLALGARLRALLRADDQRVLLDAIANLDYLNVLVLSNAPQRFILDVDADPVRVALYATRQEFHLKRDNSEIVRAYLTDKFGLETGLDTALLRTRNIGYVLVRNEGFIRALNDNPQVTRKESFGPWVLFALRDDEGRVDAGGSDSVSH
jgi:hypothetical protein